MKKEFGKLEWFGGNQDALNMYRMFVDLAHTWDDMVDKDKALTEAQVNNAFLIALCYLPANPFYRQIQDAVLPMWVTVVSAYETANRFEREKDQHGLEISHMLRYAAGNIVAYAVHVCVGAEKAKDIMPEVWKHMVAERLGDYVNEVTACSR
ncbi:MAG: hypothetical protein EBS53_06725 [Bacteroidetes bacterium]|nr:hypothetical protein [Bacteroidota bacterium]